jgi:hypothetical protein
VEGAAAGAQLQVEGAAAGAQLQVEGAAAGAPLLMEVASGAQVEVRLPNMFRQAALCCTCLFFLAAAECPLTAFHAASQVMRWEASRQAISLHPSNLCSRESRGAC